MLRFPLVEGRFHALDILHDPLGAAVIHKISDITADALPTDLQWEPHLSCQPCDAASLGQQLEIEPPLPLGLAVKLNAIDLDATVPVFVPVTVQ